MAYQFGSRILRSSRGQTSTPGESGPGSNLNFLNALSSQFRGASGRYTRTPEYKSLMLRDPRSTTVNQQRGTSVGQEYSPLTTHPPAKPGGQGGAGDALGVDTSGMPSATGDFGSSLDSALAGNLAFGRGSTTEGPLGKLGLNTALTIAKALKMAPTSIVAKAMPKILMSQIFNPTFALPTAAHFVNEVVNAQTAAGHGADTLSQTGDPALAHGTAAFSYSQAPTITQKATNYAKGLFSGTPAVHNISSQPSPEATEAGRMAFANAAAEVGYSPNADIQGMLNADYSAQDIADVLSGSAPAPGSPSPYGAPISESFAESSDEGLFSSLASPALSFLDSAPQAAQAGTGIGQGLGQAGISASRTGGLTGSEAEAEAEAIGQAEAEFGGQSPESGGDGGDGGGTVLCTAMNDMGYMNREEKLMAHKYRMSHDLNMVRGYQKLFLPIARAMRKGRFVFMIMRPLVTRWHQNMADKLAGRDVTYKWIDKIESFFKPICKRAGERKWRIDPILK